jgi:hypothetical protein
VKEKRPCASVRVSRNSLSWSCTRTSAFGMKSFRSGVLRSWRMVPEMV